MLVWEAQSGKDDQKWETSAIAAIILDLMFVSVLVARMGEVECAGNKQDTETEKERVKGATPP